MFIISLDGRILKEAGGYLKKQELEDLAADAIKTDLILRKKNDRRLVCGTYLVAVGAIGLVIWEMVHAYYCGCK